MNKTLDTYYDLIEIYKDLDEYDQKMVWSIMQTVKKTCEKRKKDKKYVYYIGGLSDHGTYSDGDTFCLWGNEKHP